MYLEPPEFDRICRCFFSKTWDFGPIHVSLNHDGANGIFVLNVQLIILGF